MKLEPDNIRLRARAKMIDLVTTTEEHLEILDRALKEALTKAHQAGIDEAVEIVKGMKKELQEFPYDSGPEHLKKKAYNLALDDTTKALTDNK